MCANERFGSHSVTQIPLNTPQLPGVQPAADWFMSAPLNEQNENGGPQLSIEPMPLFNGNQLLPSQE
jgi:hypothetical protein